MASLLLSLKQAAEANGFALLILHHFRKGSDGSAESISGASALVNHARVAMTLETMSTEETKLYPGIMPSECSRYIRITDAKVNFSRSGETQEFLELRSVTLDNAEPPTYREGGHVQVAIPLDFAKATTRAEKLDEVQRSKIEAQIVQAVGDAVAKGEPLYLKNTGRGGSAATSIISVIDKIVRIEAGIQPRDAEKVAEDLYQTLLSRGVLAEEQVKTPSRNKRLGVVLGTKAAGRT